MDMDPPSHPLLLFLSLVSFPVLLLAQQPYIGQLTTECNNQHNASSGLGYFCNGATASCRTYLTFHSQPPYQSVSAIAALLGADPSELARSNGVSPAATFPTGQKVIAPVDCLCSGGYYQANTTYFVLRDDTYFSIANNTYQGLSTCQALENQNRTSPNGFLNAGITIAVPLRCACPTRNQARNGVRYLLSYLVDSGNIVENISLALGVAAQDVLDANGLSFQNPNINPFTTLLIPLRNEPNASQLATTPPPPPPPPPLTPSSSSNRTGVYVGIGVGVAALVMITAIGIFCALYRRRRRRPGRTLVTDASDVYKSSPEKPKGPKEEEILSGISDIGAALKVYSFKELQLATEDFAAEFRIEGSVYRAVLNGDAAAVKKMNRDVSEEINILKKINHFNLIGLSGVCFNEGTWYLVYEYVENGSLSKWVHGRTGYKVLSWVERVQIALDVANGLHYLHSCTDPPYVHKDIKSSNILLDGNLRAKIANFGLARLSEGGDGEFVLTRHIVGTIGYMAPEYLEHGLISLKLDVYALGVVMMELFTGREADAARRGGEMLLMEALASLLSEEDPTEKLRDFMDPLLEGNYPLDLALAMAQLIDGCIKKDAGSRPSMGEIVHFLSRILGTSLAWVVSKSSAESQSYDSVGKSQSEERIERR